MNDYEHRCFWEGNGWRIDGKFRLMELAEETEDYWQSKSDQNKLNIGSTKLSVFFMDVVVFNEKRKS